MIIVQELTFTKFLNVKSPIGINERGESLDNYSIGTDFYVPIFDEEFLKAFTELNTKNYSNFHIEKDIYENDIFMEYYYNIYNGIEKLGIIVVEYPDKNSEDNRSVTYEFIKPITIPTGIGIDIPKNLWYKTTAKSSNFCNGYSVVDGKIDMNYTYGSGIQIFPLDNRTNITLTENQKFAQMIFIEAVPIMSFTEISQDEWNNSESIIKKRNIRTGGFGSQGTH